MRLSTRSTYGLRAMCELALQWGKGPVAVSVISEKEKLSVAYLEKLLNHLKHYELVKSIRGAKGGYVLAREPKDISVGEIIRVLEGDVAQLLFMDKKGSKRPAEDTPAGRMLFVLLNRLSMLISESLNSLSLERLCLDPRVLELVIKEGNESLLSEVDAELVGVE